MGVPKFFRYISERYPCLSEKLKEYQIPEFDNLYLDMNGIIHNCSHPNDADVSFRITEETIFKNIFHYVEILFRIIQPQKLFFMAVDGVAPRAKINQQRGRRFRAAKDAEVQEAKAKAKGQEIPKEARFDSNCITPGTVFMSKLNEQLRYFISYKVTTDKLWQKCKIILSGSEVPGEGEHKIMDYIRFLKSQPDYEGNTRHCLYGLDADLIMLGLCSHEPHFSLLREEVKFGKQQKKILTPEETNFCLLHLSLLREYLEHEFSPVKSRLTFKFDVEKIIDDWILIGFLIGNDFIPHLPNLHIENNALPILYNAYMEVLPTLDGYINEAGTLNLPRFEKFMEKLGELDMQSFDEIYADLKFFEAKTGRRLNESGRESKSTPDGSPKKFNRALDALIMATAAELDNSEDEDGDDEDSEELDDGDMQLEFNQHKRDYYMNKMEYADIDAEIMRSQAEGYVRALQWNLNYYYNGCCSWSWYYPHHYAPFISDIKNFKDLKLEFDMGKPFNPFEQLLAVLPAASKELLPKAYHGLMTEDNSPIIKYYPVDFKTDLNGKKQEWEAVVLIPLIDEKSLLSAMEPCAAKLSPAEVKRNTHGPMCIFTYAEQDQGVYEAPEYFPSFRSVAKMVLIDREKILVSPEKLVKGLCKGVKLSVYYPGFPTLQHIPHTAALAQAKVRVFEQASRRESMMLNVLPKQTPSIEELAQKWLGKTVFVLWPHLVEAIVLAVSNNKKRISIPHPKQSNGNSPNFSREDMDDKMISAWNVQRKSITEHYRSRLGIDVGDIDIVVHACPMTGRQYVYGQQGKMTLEKQWSDNAASFAYQIVLKDINVFNPDFIQFSSISDVFKPKAVCFMLGHPHYGAMGEVVEPGVDLKTSRVKVAMRVATEPSFDRVKQLQSDVRLKYMPGNIAAQRLGISSHLLSRITGTIFVINGDGSNTSNASKQNIGLNLKYNKKNEEVPGFTKKDHNNVWLYSTKAVDYVKSYMNQFPEMFERLESNLLSSDMFLKNDLFPKSGSDGLDAAATWIKEQQKALGTTTRTCGSEELDSEVVKAIEKEIDETIEARNQSAKTVIMQVKPHLLYKPGLNSRSLPPDPKAQHRMMDRIICVRENATVPMGMKGTIIGIQKHDDPRLNMYEVLFDKAFPGGFTLHESSPMRCCRVSGTDFINISYGLHVENKNNVNKVSASSPSWRQSQPQHQQQQSPNSNRFFNSDNTSSAFNQPRKADQSWRQQQPPQFQPPDPAILNSFYPAFTKGQNNSGNNKRMQQSQQKNQLPGKGGFNDSPKRNVAQSKFPQPPIVLQRNNEPEKKLPPQLPPQVLLQNVQNPQNQTKEQSEFQALWNELNKIQQKPADAPKNLPQPQFPTASDKPTPLPSAVKDSPQDPSAFLKAMLKISDDSTQSNEKPSASAMPKAMAAVTATAPQPPPPVLQNKPIAFSQTPKTSTDTPPMVQQLFDHARQTEMNSGKSIFYCSKLLTHFQITGHGFPRYVYCANKDGTICAQITLPDARSFCGDFCCNHTDAAESVAKKVYEELGLDKPQSGNSRPSPLRPPPQQWFNNTNPNPNANRMAANVRQPLPPPQANVKPILPSAFPQMPMNMPMPKWSPMVQQKSAFGMPQMHAANNQQHHQMNQNRQQQQLPMTQNKPQQGRFPQPPTQVNLQQQNRPIPPQQDNQHEAVKKSTPFVPLQAQKKRNVAKKPQGNEKNDNNKPPQQQTQQQQPQQQQYQQQQQQYQQQQQRRDSRSEQKPRENAPKDAKQDKNSGGNQKSSGSGNQSNQEQNAQQKNQKVAKPKRSRVAAKFLSDSMANGQ